jgi:hypothetical protein
LEHDVYTFFDALLTKLGVSKLYQETKDIGDLAAEMSKSAPDPELFGIDPREAQKRRKLAEQAFEREKSKVNPLQSLLISCYRLTLYGAVVISMTSIRLSWTLDCTNICAIMRSFQSCT